MKVAEKGIDPSFQKICEENIEDVSIEQCGKNTGQVLGDYVTSVLQLNKLRDQVRAYSNRADIRNNPQRRKSVEAVSHRLQCMRKEFDKYKISCSCPRYPKGDAFAYVLLNKTKEIYICNAYFDRKQRSLRSAVLLHEVSHKCGTRDWKYLNGYDGKFNHYPIETQKMNMAGSWFKVPVRNLTPNNADNFEYWALRGFCLPDYDCKKTSNNKTFTEKLREKMMQFISLK